MARVGTRRALISRASVAAETAWYRAGGAAAPLVAYQAKGASSYAASLINLANPGTYNASDDGTIYTPTWAGASGWTFDGADQFLNTDLDLPANSGYSLLIRFSDFVPQAETTSGLCGFYITFGADAYFGFEDGVTNWYYYNGDVGQETAVAMTNVGGVFGIRAGRYVFDGTEGATNISGGDTTPHTFFIGCSGGAAEGAIYQFSIVKIQALAVWNTELTLAQMQACSTAMAAL